MSELQGVILGKRYEIIRLLGGGGMSIVYLARDIILNRQVTVKILREQFAYDEDFVKRFHREAQAVASLSHPNIVSLYDVGQQDNWHYLIMEYVEGTTLKDIITERAPLSPSEAVNFAQQICDALSHAHDKGIIHRDIKPHNILVTSKGRIKVTDFGIARAVSSATLTYSGNMIGSVHYFSPEQAKGSPGDEKSDIYSLGVVLFEMLTAALPFEGDSPISIAIQHIQNEPPNPQDINPAISDRLNAIILKALSKVSSLRFSNALEMRWELDNILNNEPKPIVEAEFDPITTTLVAPAVEVEEENEVKPPAVRKRIKPVGWGIIGVVALLLLIFAYKSLMNFLIVPVIKVPDVTGKPYQTAKTILEKQGLLAEYNKIFSEDVPADHVISQTPDPGMDVKQGRLITLLVSQGAKQVEVPDLLKKTRNEAENELRNAGLIAEVDEEFSANTEEGLVFEQNPKTGAKVAQGSLVKIKISKGNKPEYVTMPDLKGMYLDEAKKALAAIGLKLGVVSKRESTEYFIWEIMSQDVEPYASIQQGSPVNLVVSQGPGPTTSSAHVSIPLPEDGVPHRVKIVVIDAKGTHEEYNATHEAGEFVEQDVPYFGKGKIQVFIDDILSVEQQVE